MSLFLTWLFVGCMTRIFFKRIYSTNTILFVPILFVLFLFFGFVFMSGLVVIIFRWIII